MRKKAFFLILFHFVLIKIWGQNDFETRLKNFNLDENYIAIKGYDPVAYFESHQAKKGDKKYSCSYKSVVYHFSSQKTLDLFKENPDKYEPAYGGWCAYTMAMSGEKATVNPEIFKIQHGKLFLFCDPFFSNTLKSWEQANPDTLEQKANNYWKNIITKE